MSERLTTPELIIEGGAHVRMARVLLLILLFIIIAALSVLVGCVTQPWVRPLPSQGVHPDPKRLERDVRLLAERHAPRGYLDLERMDAVANHIHEIFRAAGARTDVQVFQVSGRTYRNILAHFGPDTGPRVVVGAHYDTAEQTPGADDNASGVAGLLELARLFGDQPPSFPLELVAFTLEEPPHFRTQHMGSVRHARRLKQLGVPVKAMLCIEMIGCFSDEPGSQHYPSSLLQPFYPDRGNFIAVVGRWSDIGLVRRVKSAMRGASDLPVVSINAPRWVPGLDFSDHRAYWDQDFKAAMITDTAFYRNRAYHTPRDTPDRLDYVRMGHVIAAVHGAIRALGHAS